MKYLYLIILSLLLYNPCYGVGAPDFLPDGPHPRIWLDATRLAELDAYQESEDARWTAIESWCDVHLNDSGYSNGDPRWDGDGSYNSYRGFGYLKYLATYALAYQILKDDNPTKANSYAAYTIQIMHGMATGFSVGEETNGLKMIRISEVNDLTVNPAEALAIGVQTATYKLGYTARTFGTAFPLAYDWVHDRLTTEEKTLFSGIMYRWVDWYRGERTSYNNGVLLSGIRYYEDRDGDCTGANNCTSYTGDAVLGEDASQSYEVGGNFNTCYVEMAGLVALATHGDVPSAGTTYYNHFRTTLWETLIKPQLLSYTKYKGGGTVEGWNYGSSWHRIHESLYGWYTATGENLFFAFDWPVEFLKSYIHAAHSDLKNMIIHGEWTGSSAGVLDDAWLLSPSYVIRRFYPSENISSVGQYFLNTATFSGQSELYHDFLFNDPLASSSNPQSASVPLAYHEQGVGRFTSRSSWDTPDTSVHISAQLGGWKELNHSTYDEGNLLITRGADRLLVHQNMQKYTDSQNTIRFAGQNHFTRNSDLQSPVIDRVKTDNSTYAYVSGDIAHAWTKQYQTDRVKMFRRSVLHLRPGVVVVSDITRSNPVIGNQKQLLLQFAADPTVSGINASVVKGSSKLFASVLYPDGAFTETNPSTGYYRLSFAPTATQEYDQFLHVIEATGGTSSQTTATLIAGTGGRGALIGTTAAMFTDNQDGANISNLAYTVDATTHYIADLPKNTDINVARGGSAIAGSPYNSGDAGIISFSVASGSDDYTVAVGAYVPPDPVCGPENLNLCTLINCSTDGGGYWWGTQATCHATPEPPTSTGITFGTGGTIEIAPAVTGGASIGVVQ